jgi:UDP-galactopyranose mutase
MNTMDFRGDFASPPLLLCFSHLRWSFVRQRPQHLMSRAARSRAVVFWEEPIFERECPHLLEVRLEDEGVTVCTPHLPPELDQSQQYACQRRMLDLVLRELRSNAPALWYYTPAALEFSNHLTGPPVIYDCMDELSVFLGADPRLPAQERALLRRADLVFTGGQSLYAAKRRHHENVHVFPSGVDIDHFRPARGAQRDPEDQRGIAHPRLGFYGVIDERLDYALLTDLAAMRPDWQFVLVGPVVKVDPAALPRAGNIHYLGAKQYADLPAYLSGWDVALMPFARNDATRFISPTKTPEYLAGGKPVVSTPIVDVVRQYGSTRGVWIAESPSAFAAAVERALQLAPGTWMSALDAALADADWDGIWARMDTLISLAALTGRHLKERVR